MNANENLEAELQTQTMRIKQLEVDYTESEAKS